MEKTRKYRIWDEKTKKYDNNPYRDYCLLPDGDLLILDNTFYESGPVFRPIKDDSRYVMEWCSGQEDKNGKLIYEGDYVRVKYGDQYLSYVVRYDAQLSGLYYDGGDQESSESFDVFYYEEKEVVGNIHDGEVSSIRQHKEGL